MADMLAGLTAHEADCGARTVECDVCGRRMRLKEMGVHLKLHDNERKMRAPPRNCRNINCTRPRGENVLGLCTVCPPPPFLVFLPTIDLSFQSFLPDGC
jgi:hypothetical protein